MRAGCDLPKVGEAWAGWPGYSNTPRRMEVVRVYNNNNFRVQYNRRGVGMVEEDLQQIYLIQPWDSFAAEQKQRKADKEFCKQLTLDVRQAFRHVGLDNLYPCITGADSKVQISMNSMELDRLTELLESINSSNNHSALEQLFQ